MKTVLCVFGQIVLCLFVFVGAVNAQEKGQCPTPNDEKKGDEKKTELAISLSVIPSIKNLNEPTFQRSDPMITETFVLTVTHCSGPSLQLEGVSTSQMYTLEVRPIGAPGGRPVWTGPHGRPLEQSTTSLALDDRHPMKITVDWDFESSKVKEGDYLATVTLGDYLATTNIPSANEQNEKIFNIRAHSLLTTINFTGALFGYFRLPDKQLIGDDEVISKTKNIDSKNPMEDFFCYDPTDPLNGPDKMSRDARIFIQHYQDKSKGDSLLLGTGDNFSPNYFSRAFFDGGNEYHHEKELYDWDWEHKRWKFYKESPQDDSNNISIHRQGLGTIPTDNVGCFLSYAGYAAVVPGKHDFHYGPERLRELARFMASIPDDSDSHFHPVQMLGSNIVIKTTWTSDHKPLPGNLKEKLDDPMKFETKYMPDENNKSPKCDHGEPKNCKIAFDEFTDNHFVYPWLREIPITVTGWNLDDLKAQFVFFVCGADLDDPERFLLKEQCRGAHSPDIRLSLQQEPQYIKEDRIRKSPTGGADIDPVTGEANLHFVLRFVSGPELDPGRNYAVCAASKAWKEGEWKQYTGGQRGMVVKKVQVPAPYCVPFSAFTPFFEYSAGVGASMSDMYHQFRNPARYVLKKLSDGTEVVVFGIVAQDLVQYVGISNRAWEITTDGSDNPKKQYSTQIAIADPQKAIAQLETYFDYVYRNTHYGEEFHGVRVLLAQMAPTEARDFASLLPQSLRFDVVITQADDQLSTPNEHVTVARPSVLSPSDNASNKPQTFIAVPPLHDSTANSSMDRWVKVRTLNVLTDATMHWNFNLSGEALPVSVPDANPAKAKAFWDLVETEFIRKFCITPMPPDKCGQFPVVGMKSLSPRQIEQLREQALQQLALDAMRSQYRADAALLQSRDFYFDGVKDFLSEHCMDQDTNLVHEDTQKCTDEITNYFQEIVDRIIWKGDFTRTISVQGATLRKVMDQSKKFKADADSCCLIVPETGRDLLPIGVGTDPDSQGYTINGAPLDPNRLYTVAVSDYISMGDTGYADLATAPVGKPYSNFDSGELVSIASGTCFSIQSDGKPVTKEARKASASKCSKDIPATPFYYDTFLNMHPDDRRQGMTNWQTLLLWAGYHPGFGSPSEASNKKNAVEKTPEEKSPTANKHQPGKKDSIAVFTEKEAEERPRWELYFDQLSVGFTDLAHNYSETTLGNLYGGVLDSQVTAKHSRNLTYNVDGKWTFFHRRFDLFFSPSLNYSSTITAQASGPPSETQSTNLLTLDFGTNIHIRNQMELPNLFWVIDAHLETQVADPFTSIKLATTANPGALPLNFSDGRTHLLLQRSGLRWQNRKSYIEGGLEGGATLNSIKEFDIHDLTGTVVLSCLETSVSLQNCITNFNKTAPSSEQITSQFTVTAPRDLIPRYGAYWNLGLTVPFRSNISYTLTDTGDFFFNSSGDNSANTRLRNNIVQSLQFFVLPNLSFEPTLTIYLYENKVNYDFLFQRQYMVKINYSFDWTNRHETGRELQYKKPTTQQ
ncbi:MAG TPA: 5'-nucleotidase C-terminal domain-containing protein [Candidatus Acidoferrales bacterium]|jgi:hypothetical protein|nr:5'-nucleotidase C-terminal domain-containing protein [Candidatus Acidoferrales bacterium]